MSFRPGPCCRAWTSGTLTWLRAWGKTPMVFPGIPVELLWRYVASWKMWYLETHEKECSCQLSWCHLGQWCNWRGREQLPFPFAVSPKRAVLAEWPSCHHSCCGQTFSPLQTKKFATWRLTQAGCTAGDTSGGKKGFCELALSFSGQCQLGLL